MSQNYKFLPGERIQIDLIVGECYIGDFKLSDKHKIEANNVYDVIENEELFGTQNFYKNEIKSVKVHQPVNNNNNEYDDNNNEQFYDDTGAEEHIPKITMNEIVMFEYRIKNSIYIYKLDQTYDDSIKYISEQESIVMNIESDYGRNRHPIPSIITILTKEYIYIFDIIYLDGIQPELRQILESENLIKILHGSRKIAEDLRIRLNIHIRCIFDTLTSHLGSDDQTNSGTDLYDCVHKYYKVPIFFCCSKEEKNIDWIVRPLNKNYTLLTAKKVLFVQMLYDVLLHKNILHDFFNTCEIFLDVYRSKTDYCDSSIQISTNGKQYLEYIKWADSFK